MTTDPCECEDVCSLPAEELRERVAIVRAEILPLVRRRQTLPDGIVWEFDAGAGMRARLERFVEFERQCCGSLAFDIEGPPNTDALQLSVRGVDVARFEALGAPAPVVPKGKACGHGPSQSSGKAGRSPRLLSEKKPR